MSDNNNNNNEMIAQNASVNKAKTYKIGNTWYTVTVHFSKTSKEVLEDKIKRLIKNDDELIDNDPQNK